MNQTVRFVNGAADLIRLWRTNTKVVGCSIGYESLGRFNLSKNFIELLDLHARAQR